jgi:hypothetical protein
MTSPGSGVLTDDVLEVALARQLERIASRNVPFVEWLKGVRIEDATTFRVIRMELWPHLAERAAAWQTGLSEDILKARQLGLSWLLAAYAVYVGRKSHANVLLISQGLLESKELLEKVEFIATHYLAPGAEWDAKSPIRLRKSTGTDLRIEGGGTIRALPSTADAGRSFTASLVVVDEAAFHDYAEENYRAYYPTVADGGQLLVVSTSAGPAGWFFQRFVRSLRAVFIPWWARPDRGTAWLAETKAEMTTEEFQREFPATQEEAFAASAGLALAFSREKHVAAKHPVRFEDCFIRAAGFDPGGDDPTAVVIMGAYRVEGGPIRWHQFAELYRPGVVSMDEIVEYLFAHGVRTVIGDFGPKSPYVGQFARYGIKAHGAKKSRGRQWTKHAEVLRSQRLTIHASCESVVEYLSYWWNRRAPGAFATTTGEGHHFDAGQAREYVMVYFEDALERGELGMKPANMRVRYSKRATSQSRERETSPNVRFGRSK